LDDTKLSERSGTRFADIEIAITEHCSNEAPTSIMPQGVTGPLGLEEKRTPTARGLAAQRTRSAPVLGLEPARIKIADEGGVI